jgi:hypothetical protein
VEFEWQNNYNILTYLNTTYYLLTQWSQILIEQLTGLNLVKIFLVFSGTRIFITAFTSARRLSLYWARSIQSIPPHPTYWNSILILYSHLRLGLPSGLFPSGFSSNTLYTSVLPKMQATCPSHLILLDFVNRMIYGKEYKPYNINYTNWKYSCSRYTCYYPGFKIKINVIIVFNFSAFWRTFF